jgi:hypothetical protein
MAVTIAKESPVSPDLTLLFTRHTADMHADTPPESIHMMDASELAIPAVQFFVARALYERAGYSICGPFEGYWDDPNSLFMTKSLV